MERPEYRDQLEDLLDFFDGKRLVTATDVAAYTKRSRQFCAKAYGIDKQGITLPVLARRMIN